MSLKDLECYMSAQVELRLKWCETLDGGGGDDDGADRDAAGAGGPEPSARGVRVGAGGERRRPHAAAARGAQRAAAHGRAVQVDPIKPTLKRLELSA